MWTYGQCVMMVLLLCALPARPQPACATDWLYAAECDVLSADCYVPRPEDFCIWYPMIIPGGAWTCGRVDNTISNDHTPNSFRAYCARSPNETLFGPSSQFFQCENMQVVRYDCKPTGSGECGVEQTLNGRVICAIAANRTVLPAYTVLPNYDWEGNYNISRSVMLWCNSTVNPINAAQDQCTTTASSPYYYFTNATHRAAASLRLSLLLLLGTLVCVT